MLLLPRRAALLAKQLEANSRQAARRSQLRKVAKRERLQQPKLLIGKKKVYVCCGGVCEAGECFIHGLCRDPRLVLDVALSEELAHSRGSLRKAKASNAVVRCPMAVFLMLELSQVLPAQRLLQEKFASYRHRQLFETGRQRRCARRCCTPCKLYSSLMLVLFQSAQAQDEGGRGARRAGVDFWFSVAFQYRLCSPTVVTPMLAATRSLRIVRIYHHI